MSSLYQLFCHNNWKILKTLYYLLNFAFLDIWMVNELDMPTDLKDNTSKHKLKSKIWWSLYLCYHHNKPSCVHPDLTTSMSIKVIYVYLILHFFLVMSMPDIHVSSKSDYTTYAESSSSWRTSHYTSKEEVHFPSVLCSGDW